MLEISRGLRIRDQLELGVPNLAENGLDSGFATTIHGGSVLRALPPKSIGEKDSPGSLNCVNEDHGRVPLIEHLKFECLVAGIRGRWPENAVKQGRGGYRATEERNEKEERKWGQKK
ncbi:hypothetical protein JCGZ_13491 [Jatropha curcas]|uniref:Uncharacterized protein n=1 Tax=Jatropha curcas TaxID=180498 RepID=A0A067LMK3_JATCU|nr:hypothetical protein JCGZ_13491 [Jatropha curcas]